MTKKNTTMNPPKETPIDDLSLAAYLKTRDYPLLRIDESPRGLTFVFSDVSEGALAGFFSGGSVPAKAYADNLKYLKGEIFRWKRKNDIAPRSWYHEDIR